MMHFDPFVVGAILALTPVCYSAAAIGARWHRRHCPGCESCTPDET